MALYLRLTKKSSIVPDGLTLKLQLQKREISSIKNQLTTTRKVKV